MKSYLNEQLAYIRNISDSLPNITKYLETCITDLRSVPDTMERMGDLYDYEANYADYEYTLDFYEKSDDETFLSDLLKTDVFYTEDIFRKYPTPKSAKLENLANEIQVSQWSVFDFIKEQSPENILLGWAEASSKHNKYGDGTAPSWYANQYADILEKTITFINTNMTVKFSKIYKDWQNEGRAVVNDIEIANNEALRDNIHVGDIKSVTDEEYHTKMLMIKDISNAKNVVMYCSKTLQKIKNADERYVKNVIKNFIDESENIKNVINIEGNDLNELKSVQENLKDINKSLKNDTKSFSMIKEQVDSASIAVDNFKSYWVKRYNKMVDIYNDPSSKSDRITYPGIPNYRFKIGERVKTKKGNKTGKIIGIQKEGGSGKQLYTVRLDSEDGFKLFASLDLSRE